MLARLVLGKLYPNAALLPQRLDERLRSIVSVVNGGLTAANLAAAYKLPAAAFTEGRQLLVVGFRVPTHQTIRDRAHAPQLPAAATLVAIDLVMGWFNGFKDITGLQFVRYKADGTQQVILNPVRKTSMPAWATKYPVADGMTRIGGSWRGSVAFAAGDSLLVNCGGAGPVPVDGHGIGLFVMDPVA